MLRIKGNTVRDFYDKNLNAEAAPATVISELSVIKPPLRKSLCGKADR